MLTRFFSTLILVSVLLFAAIWGWFKVSGVQFMPVKTVKITGKCSRLDPQLVQQTVRSVLNECNFLTLKTGQLQERLLEVPWVSSAKVVREWPAKLHIQLTEYDVVARWNGSSFLSSNGELLVAKIESALPEIPFLSGPESQRQFVWQQYKAMKTMLDPLGLRITHLAFSTRHAWRVRLENGLVLVLGRTDTLKRLKRIVGMYSQIIGSRSDQVDYIDLRYANAIAVRWKDTNA